MHIIKVIVDELPISCGECPYALVDDWADDENGLVYFCSALSVLPDGVQDNALGDLVIADHGSPDWCPLILEEDVETWLMTRPQKPKYVLCDNKD